MSAVGVALLAAAPVGPAELEAAATGVTRTVMFGVALCMVVMSLVAAAYGIENQKRSRHLTVLALFRCLGLTSGRIRALVLGVWVMSSLAVTAATLLVTSWLADGSPLKELRWWFVAWYWCLFVLALPRALQVFVRLRPLHAFGLPVRDSRPRLGGLLCVALALAVTGLVALILAGFPDGEPGLVLMMVMVGSWALLGTVLWLRMVLAGALRRIGGARTEQDGPGWTAVMNAQLVLVTGIASTVYVAVTGVVPHVRPVVLPAGLPSDVHPFMLLALFMSGGIVLLLVPALVGQSLWRRVTGRTPEIALLRALGTTPTGVAAPIVGQGALGGLIGAALGVPFGAWLGQLCLAIGGLPVGEVPGGDLVGLGLGVVVTAVVGSLFPAVRAARLPPMSARPPMVLG